MLSLFLLFHSLQQRKKENNFSFIETAVGENY